MSLRKAINEKCKDCIYDPLCPGTWRKQVEECTSPDCALWPHRPKTNPKRRGYGTEEECSDVIQGDRQAVRDERNGG